MKYLGRQIDFRKPLLEPALLPPQSITWQVFKNPVTMAIGGIAAVLLELAEPRVRSGVWDHSTFEKKPFLRIIRTGFAAYICVYAPKDTALSIIADVTRMHGHVKGTTPSGVAYHANDPALLSWVHVTASYGFLNSYCTYVRPLSQEAQDRLYQESQSVGVYFGATDLPSNVAEQKAMFAETLPLMEQSDIVFDFLKIVRKALPLPPPFRGMIVRAAVSLLPIEVQEKLAIQHLGLKKYDAAVLRKLAWLAERLPIPFSPPVQASQRMGLSWRYLFKA